MWGTIAKMKVKPGAEAFIGTQFHSMRNAERMPGWLFTQLFQSDSDPNEVWMIAMFTDKESYRRNAESPGQHRVYEMIRSCLVEDPEWHDVAEFDLVAGGGPQGVGNAGGGA
jgi:heme-degrading monooxygenase HmoA